MGLILRPNEVKNSAKQIRSSIEGNRESYIGTVQIVHNFGGNQALQSKSWDTIKEKILNAHQTVMNGMAAASDIMLADIDAAVGVLDGDALDEEQLLRQIKFLEEECERYINTIKQLSELRSRSLIGGQFISQMIKGYQDLLERTREELEIIKELLNSLYEKADQTSTLFQPIPTLLKAVECAINDAEVYISGYGTLSGVKWWEIIPQEIAKLNGDIDCEWIPEVMRLDGDTEQEKALAQRINGLNKGIENPALQWNQGKIDKVWEKCEEYYREHGVQVDPRLLLAIICSEGSGSFNTNSAEKAADGGNGPQTDFEKDVDYALDLVGGKVIAYAHYQQDFSNAKAEAYEAGRLGIKDYDDILHYINWQTPR